MLCRNNVGLDFKFFVAHNIEEHFIRANRSRWQTRFIETVSAALLMSNLVTAENDYFGAIVTVLLPLS
jgi:hypothetical protein